MAVKLNYDENASKRKKQSNYSTRDVSSNPYADDIDDLDFDEEDIEQEEEDLSDLIDKYENEPLREGETIEDRDRRIKLLRKQEKLRQREMGRTKALGTMTAGRILSLVITGLLWSAALVFINYTLYMRWVRFPPEKKVKHEMFGAYCLENWSECLKERDSGKIGEFIGEKSYLEEETKYANSNNLRIDFFNKMLSTVEYTPDEVDAYNIYGNYYVDKKTKKTVRTTDEVTLDSTVALSYVDYASVEIDEARIKEMLSEYSTSLGAAGYTDDLTDMFCDYMCNYIVELPIKTEEKYKPHFILNVDGSYALSPEEDIYLDKLLFSSKEFYDLLERFSLAAGKGATNPQWLIWSTAKQTANTSVTMAEPAEKFDELPVNSDWLTWNSQENKKANEEPVKYNPDYVIGHDWCGAYYLQNEYFEYDSNGNKVYRVIDAPRGNGKLENPASLNTPIYTTTEWTGPSSSGLNVTLDMPISVKMVEYGVSQDALDWFVSKDERNRGHDIKSELQFVYYVFEIKNLSDRSLVINDNSSLCDAGINLYPRTGSIYGLTSQIKLNPGETGRIESWSSSTTLNRLYVIWGANFKRKQDVVWFRQLQGNLEDTSWNKGVAVNTTREGEEALKQKSGTQPQSEVSQAENTVVQDGNGNTVSDDEWKKMMQEHLNG